MAVFSCFLSLNAALCQGRRGCAFMWTLGQQWHRRVRDTWYNNARQPFIMAMPHYFLTSVIVCAAPHELFTGELSSQNDRGRWQRAANEKKQKTSVKIGEGICQEREALIRFLMLAISFLCRGVSMQRCRKHTDTRFTIWITHCEFVCCFQMKQTNLKSAIRF